MAKLTAASLQAFFCQPSSDRLYCYPEKDVNELVEKMNLCDFPTFFLQYDSSFECVWIHGKCASACLTAFPPFPVCPTVLLAQTRETASECSSLTSACFWSDSPSGCCVALWSRKGRRRKWASTTKTSTQRNK